MPGAFSHPFLGFVEFDAGAPLANPEVYGLYGERYIPPNRRTPADIKLLEQCKTFGIFLADAQWLESSGDPDTDPNAVLPRDYPWDYMKWLTQDPVLRVFVDKKIQRALEETELNGYEVKPLLTTGNSEIPHSRSAYFAYATTQAMLARQWHSVISRVKEAGPLELDVYFDPRDFAGGIWPDTPTQNNWIGVIRSRLNRLGVNANMQIKMEELAQSWLDHSGQYLRFTPYPRLDFDASVTFPEAFWHWGGMTFHDLSGRLLEEPRSCGCPAVFPSLMVTPTRYLPIIEATNLNVIQTEVITEYEVNPPSWFGPDFNAYGMIFDATNGTFIQDVPNSFEPGTPTYGANTDTRKLVTVSGDTTTTQTNAAYAVFQVREWYLGPQINPNTGNLVGVSSRPTLMLIDEEGNSFERSSSPERLRLRERAERIAVEQLYGMWGFIPAWAEMNGFNRDTYVNFHRGFYKNFESWKYWYQLASLDEKQRMLDFDYVFPYIFSVMVADDTVNTTTTESSTSTETVTESLQSIIIRDDRYIRTDTRIEQHVRAQIKLYWKKLAFNEEVTNEAASIAMDELYQAPGISPYYVGFASVISSSEYEVDNHIAHMVFRQWAYDPTSWIKEDITAFDLESTEGDLAYLSLPALTLDQSRMLTKHLFTPGETILHYLPSVGKESLDAQQGIIKSYLGQLPGSVWLNQYGSQAPLFPVFQEALVLDTQLNKWGKMSVPHRLLVDLSPVNSHRQRRVASSTFSIQAAMLGVEGQLFTFNDKPEYSELRYGKLGYHRLGFTDLEEMRIWFAKQSTGILQIEPSYSGDRPESSFIQEFEFDDTTSIVTNYSLSARWYNVTLKGQYDVKGIEFIGRKSARR